LFAAALAFGGCEDVLNGANAVKEQVPENSGKSKQTGSVRVVFNLSNAAPEPALNISGAGGPLFTVYPEAGLNDIDIYTVSFTPSTGTAPPDQNFTPDTNGGVDETIVLPVGIYTITAKAIVNEEVIAVGSTEGVSVNTGTTAEANITMGPYTESAGTGTFAYSITVEGLPLQYAITGSKPVGKFYVLFLWAIVFITFYTAVVAADKKI
jgi:hypothetical protein